MSTFSTLPEELVELTFDKLLEHYPPDLENESLFSVNDRRVLSALTTISLMVARRTRTHRFKCVVLTLSRLKFAKVFKIMASFLELSFSSRRMGRLLPISTITSHVKVISGYCDDWDHGISNLANDPRATSFMLRLRNEFCLEKLSWSFDWRFQPSKAFYQRFAGLLLSPTLKSLSIRNLKSDSSQLRGTYIPGPSFDRLVRFGEKDETGQLRSAGEVYPSYTVLELGGYSTAGLPLPFEASLPDGSLYRPFACVETFRAFGLHHSVTQSVLENNHGSLRVLQIEESFDLLAQLSLPSLMDWNSSKSPSPIDFSRLPRLHKMKVEHFILRYVTDSGLRKIRDFTLKALLHIFSIASPHASTNPISVESIDLGGIPLLLIEDSALNRRSPLLDADNPNLYSAHLAKVLPPSDMNSWESLNAALCTSRFAKLATLTMDYIVFDDRAPQRSKFTLPGIQWLFITKKIFPRTHADGRIGLKGRIIVVDLPRSDYIPVDYSKVFYAIDLGLGTMWQCRRFVTYPGLLLTIMEDLYGSMPGEIVELIFDKLLAHYPPDLDAQESLFSLNYRRALSLLSSVSLLAARRTRIHRFKCVVLLCDEDLPAFYQLLDSFLEISSSSRPMGRLLPISSITTHIKVVLLGGQSLGMRSQKHLYEARVSSFFLRLRNEFSLEQLSWAFDPILCRHQSVKFFQRLAGLLLSPGMKVLSVTDFFDPRGLQGAYIPGPSFDNVVRFGEESHVEQALDARKRLEVSYPSFTKLQLGGEATSGLPLPFAIPLPDGAVYRPFACVRTLLAFGGISYSIIESVLDKNDGSLEVLHIEESFDLADRVVISVTPRSKPTSPIPFTRLPNIRELKLDYIPSKCSTGSTFDVTRSLALQSLLSLFDITATFQTGEIPIETLDLGRICFPLVPHPPSSYLTAVFPDAVEAYSKEVANAPVPLDMQGHWQVLDYALCSSRFPNLKILKVDYVLFDNCDLHETPEASAEHVEGLGQVRPDEWLDITKEIFPSVVAADRIGLEGRVLQLRVPGSIREPINYSIAILRSRYP